MVSPYVYVFDSSICVAGVNRCYHPTQGRFQKQLGVARRRSGAARSPIHRTERSKPASVTVFRGLGHVFMRSGQLTGYRKAPWQPGFSLGRKARLGFRDPLLHTMTGKQMQEEVRFSGKAALHHAE